MITPDDIQNKEFSKAMRGYKEEEVDEFLDQITLDYEQLIAQYQDIRGQLVEANARLEEYKATEGAVLKTLESAKALMNDIAASAEKRAEILVKNAELDAELKQRQAREAVERLREEEAALFQKVSTMKVRFKGLLENELQKIDDISEEIFGGDYPSKAHAENIVKTADFIAGPGAAEKKNQDLNQTITNVRS